MFFPLCAAFAASPLISKGLAASWRLLEPPRFVWVVPGNPCWVMSVPQVGELCWKQWSTTNPAADIIDALKKRQSSGLCLFLSTGRCNMVDSAAQTAHVFLVCCSEAKFSDGWQYFSRRKCATVLWRQCSPGKEVLSSVFQSFFPLLNSKRLFAFKRSTETYYILIRTSPSHQI